MHHDSSAIPEPEMTIEVTDVSLTAGRILEDAEVLREADLIRILTFIRSRCPIAKVPESEPASEDAARSVLSRAVDVIREREPAKLAEIADFVDGVVRAAAQQPRFRTA